MEKTFKNPEDKKKALIEATNNVAPVSSRNNFNDYESPNYDYVYEEDLAYAQKENSLSKNVF